MDYRTNEAVDPETLDEMERFISMLSPLHQHALMLMTQTALAEERHEVAEEDTDEHGATILWCPYCGEDLNEVYYITGVQSHPAVWDTASARDLHVYRRRHPAPWVGFQCPECLRYIGLPSEMPVEVTP